MIKINLLPLDKRKAERTPLKGAGLMIADAAVFAVVAILVIISLIQIAHVKNEIDEKNKTLASLAEDVKKHDRLKTQAEQLERDAKDLESVTATRPFEWSEVFDKVWDVVDKHKRVWLDSIELADGGQMNSLMKQRDPDTTITGCKYGIVIKAHVAGLDVKAMTAFRMELKDDPTLSKLFPNLNWDTQWRVSDQKDYVEKFSLDFEVILINTGQKKDVSTAPPKGAAQ